MAGYSRSMLSVPAPVYIVHHPWYVVHFLQAARSTSNQGSRRRYLMLRQLQHQEHTSRCAVLLQVSMKTDDHLSLCLSRRCAQADCGVMTTSLSAAAEPAGPSAAAAACCAVGAMALHGR